MKVEVEELGGLKYRVAIDIEAADFQKELQKAARRYSPQVKVHGFRPGKAPVAMIIRQLGDTLKGEVREHLITHSFNDVLTEHKLQPSTSPKVNTTDETEDGAMKMTAEFESFPHVELKDYLGIEVVEPSYPEVRDEDVEDTITRMRAGSATFEPKEEDSVAMEGDMAVVKLLLKSEDGETELKAEHETRIVVGTDNEPVKETGRELLGMKVGEAKSLVGEPGTIMLRGLARDGKMDTENPVNIKAEWTIVKLLAKKIPELDSAFANRFAPGRDVDGFRAEVRERLEEGRAKEILQMVKDIVVDKVVGMHPIELGEETVKEVTDAAQKEARDRVLARMTPEQREEAGEDLDLGISRESSENEARKNLHQMVILQAVASAEDIEVNEEDLDVKLDEIAAGSGLPAYMIKQQLDRDTIENIARRIRVDKTVDLLARYAVVVPAAGVSGETVPALEGADVAQEVVEAAGETATVEDTGEAEAGK